MLIPATVELPEIIIGGTWEVEIKLYEDVAQTKAFDLTTWTTTLVFEGGVAKTLASGSGLTITAATGKIVALLTAAETLLLKEQRDVPHHLKLVKGAEVIFPFHGHVPVMPI